ncbi:NAD-dependent succinate-semialdehyde dehydrogenase [Georgenia sp. Z1491]|uniref:NAD-dependent succinate-semialdehyde dehydrogenase n=1 Tax=Georgenia sp. Z1491 TaxID=3416707 RepID=UPI003CF43FBB
MTTSHAPAVDAHVHSDLYIDGRWTAGAGRRAVNDPATGEVIAEVATAGPDECRAAVASAHGAASTWAATAPRQRGEILRRAFELMTAEADRIARLITRENGKALADARSEVAYAAEFFRWFSEEAVRVRGDYRPAPAGDKQIIITHAPVGVSVLITPWNFPAAMATRKIAPALAAGCTTILKPASETPLTALAIADVLERAGVPAGVVNVILPEPTGPLVKEMLDDPRVRNLSFTGSTEVGRTLLHGAADTVVRTSMELGGNAPFLVLEGADVAAAVEGAMVAKMRNGGSACTAANRFYVHASLVEEFTVALTERMAAVTVGQGDEDGVELGALVSVKERDKVAALVDGALAEGARRTTSATVPAEGAFYPPTVLVDIEPTADLLAREIFGPVAPVVAVADEDTAVRLANDTEYGLISYVYGPAGDALRVAGRLEAGMVAVNRAVVSDPAASFGGMKQSGLGREGGFDGIHEFLESKYVAVEI